MKFLTMALKTDKHSKRRQRPVRNRKQFQKKKRSIRIIRLYRFTDICQSRIQRTHTCQCNDSDQDNKTPASHIIGDFFIDNNPKG